MARRIQVTKSTRKVRSLNVREAELTSVLERLRAQKMMQELRRKLRELRGRRK